MAFGIITGELQRGFDWVLGYTWCPCKGGGFALHSADVWVRCPFHGQGIKHPESGEPDESGALAAVDRNVFAALAKEEGMSNSQLKRAIEAIAGKVDWENASRRRDAIDLAIADDFGAHR